MEQKQLTVDTKELIEAYRELLPQVDSLALNVTGHSMSPFLAENRDSVRICKITKPLKVGDMALYKRDNGQYILHRVCRVKNGTYSMIGDAHNVIEDGIRKDQIIATVKSVVRKGKLITPKSFIWKFFEKFWIRIIPLRSFFTRAYSILKIIF